MKKRGFVMYPDYEEQIEMLEAEQAKAVFIAILRYAAGKELPEMDLPARLVYTSIRQQIDRDNEKYEKTCEVRREAGRKGGRPPKQSANDENDGPIENQNKAKKPNGFSEKQSEAKKAIKDKDKDKEKDTKEIISYEITKKNQKVSENNSDHAPFRFSDFLKVYPGKIPNQPPDIILEKYRQVIAEGYQEGDVIRAAENYAEAVRIEEREGRYIKRPDNFLSSGIFKEYLPGEYVRPEPGRKHRTAADRYHAGMMERKYDYDALEGELLRERAEGT